jgi:RHH-type proline utilization regulon transcriptional repressor/proline dehydrogenase/delta 1-pyrroline-5-carboxylate dehydrogenase
MRELEGWDALDALKYPDECTAVQALLARQALSEQQRAAVTREAVALVDGARRIGARAGIVESFLQELSLNSREGLALMCLAEALLRTPDAATRDRLIAEQIASADWARHIGQADSLFVNASTWALMLTGRLFEPDVQARHDLPGFVRRLGVRLGEPVLRAAVATALRIMGEQFVLGRDIETALDHAAREGLTCSFDMLGEGARTEADAERYFSRYGAAIEAVGAASIGRGPEAGHGVSVKLSALSPRFEAKQEARVWDEAYPRLLSLATAAARHDLNLTLDAEEADRLVLSLKVLARLASEPELGDWRGLGLALQAYQPRSLAVVDALAALAHRTGRRLMVRLVKGAYWDREIKGAQVAGMPGYPVFTTKAATDVSYLACAGALLAAAPVLYPQFASHNAHTLAAVRALGQATGAAIEFQRLHGMGGALYEAAEERWGELRLRTYAPVGEHKDLVPYLVRRLLENGANSSFVRRLLDKGVPAADVVRDPLTLLATQPEQNPRIPRPRELYGARRTNPSGRDASLRTAREAARAQAERLRREVLRSGPIVGGELVGEPGELGRPVYSPADPSRLIGNVSEATTPALERAIAQARAAKPAWDSAAGPGRAKVLRAAGIALEARMDRLVALLALEAGKTFDDAVSEVREAAEFCHYYALLTERQFAGPERLVGPAGELNVLELRGRGVAACISPWNFPLAIFTGQVAAALAAGNAVVAKPAEQTPLIAAETVRLFHAAGLDPRLLALLPGDGASVGAALVAHPGVDCVAFTGGTETAWAINRALAARPGPIIPFVAETGGLNAMFVDTTALREQVIDDAIRSAFGSAGQRCSALRMLFIPQETAGELIEGLAGALATLVVGDPALPETDVGPVIDSEARTALEAHLSRLEKEARIVARHRECKLPGHFFAPVIAEVDAPDFLEREVFGPILHVCRYAPEDLDSFASRLAARGYGLTLGIHSRLDSFARRIQSLVPAGNIYVNRPMTGAVVGVQPFGGQGLSGTGPKAGGPHALMPFALERAVSTNLMARGGDPDLLEYE